MAQASSAPRLAHGMSLDQPENCRGPSQLGQGRHEVQPGRRPHQPRLGSQPGPDSRWSQELADLERGTSRVFPSIFQTKAKGFSEGISVTTENQVCVASSFSAWHPHEHVPPLLQCREGPSPWVPSSKEHREGRGKSCFGLS